MLRNRLLVISGLIFSFILSFSFFFLAVPNLEEKIIKKRDFYTLNSKIFSKTISFPQKADFVLKLKYDYKNTDGEVVYLNGNKLELRVSNRRKDTITRYYFVPYEILREGNNFLRIEFFPQAPPDIDVRLRNYLGATEDKNIVLCLRHSLIIRKEYGLLSFLSLFFFVFSFLLWYGTLKISTEWFRLNLNQAYFNNLIIFIPLSLFYFSLGVSSLFNPFRIAVTPAFLFVFLFFMVLSGELFLIFLSMITIAEKKDTGTEERIAISKDLPPWLKKIIFWVKTREFSDKCILFFMFLLILCAFFLILNMEKIAEHLANIAYLALVLGVVIKFVKVVKEEKNNSS